MVASAGQFLAAINWRFLVDVFSALLTPTIAIVATYIAFAQWRVNKTRLDMDLYDRRLAIYKALDQFYGDITISGDIRFPMVAKLQTATAEARFLFPKNIEKHLDTLHMKAFRAAQLRERLYPHSGEPGLPVGERRHKTSEDESKLLDEIQGALWDESKTLFRKYLTLA